MVMIRVRLRRRIDRIIASERIHLHGTGWRIQGTLQDNVAGHAQRPASFRVSTGKIFRDVKKSYPDRSGNLSKDMPDQPFLCFMDVFQQRGFVHAHLLCQFTGVNPPGMIEKP